MKQEISGVLLSGPSTQSTRGAILPSSGVWSLLDKLVLTNKSRLRQVLDSVVVFLLLYTATVSPFQLAFWDFRVFSETDAGDWTNPLRHPFWSAVDAVVEALFVMDLLLQFICSYTEKDIEVVSSKLICWNYVSGYFIIDAMGCLPAQAFTSLFNLVQTADTTSSTSPAKIVRLSRLTRAQKLSRVVRLSRLMRLLKFTKFKCWNEYLSKGKMIQFIVLMFMLLIAIHIMACGMYLCAALHEDVELTWLVRRTLPYTGTNLLDGTPWTCWAHSIYFVLTVFTTVGFGDISAFTIGEMAYVSLTMLVAMVIEGMVMGNILSVINGMDSEAAKLEGLKEAIDQFAFVTGLDEGTVQWFKKSAIQLTFSGQARDSEAVQKILKGHLSSDLLISLANSVFGGALKKNMFISAAARNLEFIPPRLPLLTATLLATKSFGYDAPVYTAGELALGIYLVQKGTFAHMHAELPYCLYSFNNYFGDFEVFSQLDLRTSTVRCQSEFGWLLYLASEDLSKLSEQFPSLAQVWQYDAKRRFTRARRAKREMNFEAALHVEGLAARCIVHWWRKRPCNESWHLDKVDRPTDAVTEVSSFSPGKRLSPGNSRIGMIASSVYGTDSTKQDLRTLQEIHVRGMQLRDCVDNCEQAVRNLDSDFRTLSCDISDRLAGCERALGKILSCLEEAGLSQESQESHESRTSL
eukprot:TRINITY_DN25069_c0_g1_i1.p1 TRINITY_DN25069_c0_g1~~TRINITY_DN25069_c0_g1_i1.p1  ORF type:complete len:692 (+),score=103.98 TRINITY_DN25069_c0_g1_i1:23-2098(+)